MTNEGVYMHSDLILKRDQSMYLFSFLIDKESELREVSFAGGSWVTTREHLLSAYSVPATVVNALYL